MRYGNLFLVTFCAMILSASVSIARPQGQLVTANASHKANALPSALPDSIHVYTTPSLLAEDEDNPGSAYLALGGLDTASGHNIYLHLDLEAVIVGLSPDDSIDLVVDLTTLDGVASDSNQVVGGEHVLVEVDQQSSSLVLRNPDFEETSLCHIPTHDEFENSAIGAAYESAGEELIHALVDISYNVNGGPTTTTAVLTTIGVYDPILYGAGSPLALSAGEGVSEGGGELEDPPTCIDEEETLSRKEILVESEGRSVAISEQSKTLATKSQWCLSWKSAQCKRLKDRAGKKYCPYDSCNISWARLLRIATSTLGLDVPTSLIAGESVDALSEWLEERGHATAASGKCGDVYFLGAIYVGCQCVFYVF